MTLAIDPTSLSLGLSLGLSIGVCLTATTRRRREVADEPAISPATCPCGHVISVHDADGSQCREEIRRPHYEQSGSRNGQEYVQCPCRRYMGPELLRDVWHPGTTPMPGIPIESSDKKRKDRA